VAPSQGLMAGGTSMRTMVIQPEPGAEIVNAPYEPQSAAVPKRKMGGGSYLVHYLQKWSDGDALFDMLKFDSEASPLRNAHRPQVEPEPAYQTLQGSNGLTGFHGNDVKLLIDAMATFDGRMVGDAINDLDKTSGLMTRSFFVSERMTRLEMTN